MRKGGDLTLIKDAFAQLVIVGAGDHGRVMADVARSVGRTVIGFVQPSRFGGGQDPSEVDGIPMLGALDDPLSFSDVVDFVVALGANDARAAAYRECVARGWRPTILVHPTAIQLGGVRLGDGVQVCAGAIIGLQVVVGDNVIVNTAATVDHDGRIGSHAFIGPGAHLAGRVTVGKLAHIGVGATVREGCTIGDRAYVAAGAAVVTDVVTATRVAGVPARPMEPGQEDR